MILEIIGGKNYYSVHGSPLDKDADGTNLTMADIDSGSLRNRHRKDEDFTLNKTCCEY
jgi:hypothetical protein